MYKLAYLKWITCLGLHVLPIWAADLEPIQTLTLVGEMDEGYDVSAVAVAGDQLIFGVDEGRELQWFQKHGNEYRRAGSVPLINEDEEVDVEGLTIAGSRLYAIGSHSATRKKVKASRSHAANRERLAKTDDQPDPSRNRLLRIPLPLDPGNVIVEDISGSLRQELNKNRYLRPFRNIPSKENGIDIEGLAVHDGRIVLGFRGPVLRGGYAPVMIFPVGFPGDHELRFIPLGGRGIRSIERIAKGFLLIAGPVGDSDQSYQLIEWDGRDCLPGHDGDDPRDPPCHLVDHGTLPISSDSKAEGLAVLEETPEHFQILVVYDGADQGKPSIFRIPR